MVLLFFVFFTTVCAKVAVRQDETVSELSLARVNDFGCAKQHSCLELTNTYDPCTNKYTMCLSWDACEFKNPPDTISHVCSFSFGNSACNRDVFWSGGSMCMNVFENWPSNNQVCVEVVPGAYAYYGVKDRSVCGNSNSPASYMLLNGGVSGDCVSSTSTVVGAYPYFYDCTGGNTGECLWRFLAPPAPAGVVCPPSPCSTVTSTVTVPVPTTETSTVTVPVPTTETSTVTVPVPTTETSTVTVPVPTTETSTVTVPVPTTETSTVTVPVPTTETSTVTVPVPTTETSTVTVPVPTTETSTVTVPTTETSTVTVPTTETSTVTVPTTETSTVTVPTTETSTVTVPTTETSTVTVPTTETSTVTVPTTETSTVTVPTTETSTVTVPVPTTETSTITVPVPTTETSTVTVPTTETSTVTVPTTETLTVTAPTTVIVPTTETLTVPTTKTTSVPTIKTTTVAVTKTATKPVTATVTKPCSTAIATTKPTAITTVQPGVPCGKYMCDNYSQCMAKCASGPRCKCKYGYYGTGCKYYSNTLAQKCSKLGCKNGNCVFNSQKVATCQCLPGHTGPKCL